MKLNSNNITISGLNKKTSHVLIITISVTLGMIIFALIPYIANKFSNPYTSSLLNVVPNGMILGFFVIEKNFNEYFKGLLFAPTLNVLLNLLTYVLYKYVGLSAVVSLSTSIFLWAFLLVTSYFVT